MFHRLSVNRLSVSYIVVNGNKDINGIVISQLPTTQELRRNIGRQNRRGANLRPISSPRSP
jgi:hypothetical protein